MAKYRVMLVGSASTSTEVEADSPEQAAQKAEENAYASLCHQCSHDITLNDEWNAIDPDTDTPYSIIPED